MSELTSSPIRCPCGEIEELRKYKAEFSGKLEEAKNKAFAWKQEYAEAYARYVHFRDENQQLREDNAQLSQTILTLCGVIKVVLGEAGGTNDVR